MATIVAILKFFKKHLLPNCKSLWEASELHRDSELLKLFHSDIQEGCHLVAARYLLKRLVYWIHILYTDI